MVPVDGPCVHTNHITIGEPISQPRSQIFLLKVHFGAKNEEIGIGRRVLLYSLAGGVGDELGHCLKAWYYCCHKAIASGLKVAVTQYYG